MQRLKLQYFQIADLVPLSHLTYSCMDLNDICCDQNVESVDTQKYSKAIKTDPVQNIKSENNFEEDDHNVLASKCFITINGVNSDEKIASIDVDVTRIKDEEDNISSDNESFNEICVSTLEAIKPVRKKRIKNIDLKRETKKVKNEKVTKRKKTRKSINQLSVAKENYIVIEMTDEEMLAKREADRQADRYKNKVKYRCELCISGFFHQELYDKHIRIRHSEVRFLNFHTLLNIHNMHYCSKINMFSYRLLMICEVIA